MSLREERERLRTDIDRILVTAETAEQDAEAMRQAVISALDIYSTAKALAADPRVSGSAEATMAAAADAMAKRLGELQRVRVSSEPLTLPTLGIDL